MIKSEILEMPKGGNVVIYVVNKYPDSIKGSPFALVLQGLGGSRCPPAGTPPLKTLEPTK